AAVVDDLKVESGQCEWAATTRHHADIEGPVRLDQPEIADLMAVAETSHPKAAILRNLDLAPVRDVGVRDHAFDRSVPIAGDQNPSLIEGAGIFAERKQPSDVVAADRNQPCIDRLRPVADRGNDGRIKRDTIQTTVVDGDPVVAGTDQARRGFALDADAAVIGNVEPIPLGEDAFGKEVEVPKEVARCVHRAEVFDMRILALHVNSGGAVPAGLDSRKVADRYIVSAGEDSVREIAGCSQVTVVMNRLASCVCR